MLKKLLRNFGFNAYKTIGYKKYFLFIKTFFNNIHKIKKAKSLHPLDVAFSQIFPIIEIEKFGKKFIIDLKQIDKIANEESLTFGLIREIFINNCYFEGFENITPSKLKTVLDLGGNRGIFTLLASGFANRIIYVEVQKKYEPTLKLLLESNNYKGEIIQINKYIGGKGSFLNHAEEFISMDQLFESTETDVIDFAKIDIEGAEFSLFESAEWLKKVRYIAMELHPEYGSVANILDVLIQFNFEYKLTNMSFEIIQQSKGNELLYLYAKNRTL